MEVEFTKNAITATIFATLPDVNTRVGIELWVEDAPYSNNFELVLTKQTLVDDQNQGIFYIQREIQSILGFDLPELDDFGYTVCPNVCRRWYIKQAQWQLGDAPVFGTPSTTAGGLLAGLGYYGEITDLTCPAPEVLDGVIFTMVSPTFTATVTKTGDPIQWQDHNGNIIATNTPNFTGIVLGQTITMLVDDVATVSEVDVNGVTEVSDIEGVAHVAPEAIDFICRGHSIASARIDVIISEVAANVLPVSAFIFDIYNANAWNADFTGVMVPRVNTVLALWTATHAEIKIPMMKVSTNKVGAAALNFTSSHSHTILENGVYTNSDLNYNTIGTAGSRTVYFYCREASLLTLEFSSENITEFTSATPINTTSFALHSNADLLALECNAASVFSGSFTAHQNTSMTACAVGCTFNTGQTFIHVCTALATFSPNPASVFTGHFSAYVNTLMTSCAAGCTFNTSQTIIYICPALATFSPNPASVFTGDFLFSSNTSMTACAAGATFNTDNTSIPGCSALLAFTPNIASTLTGKFYASNNTLMAACGAGATFNTNDLKINACPALLAFSPNAASTFTGSFYAYSNTLMAACGAGATFNTSDLLMNTNAALLAFSPAAASVITGTFIAYNNAVMAACGAGATFNTDDLQLFSNPSLTAFTPHNASAFTGTFWMHFTGLLFNPFNSLINAQFEGDFIDIKLDNCNMSSTLVDGILVSLADLTLNRYVLWTGVDDMIDIAGNNAAPTGSGLAAKADLLDITKSHFEDVIHT